MRTTLALITLVAVAMTCADCRRRGGAVASTDHDSGVSSAPPSSLPPCAHVEATISLPPEFPKNVPIPPGTVFTATRPTARGIVVQGLIPMERPKATRFFLEKLKAGGFQIGRGESEPEEAEAPFRGNGILGHFKLRNLRDCPGAVQLIISAQPLEQAR